MGPVALSGADYSPSGTCTGPRTSSTCTTGSADTHCSLGRNCVMRVAITVMVGHEFLRWSSAPRPTATAAPPPWLTAQYPEMLPVRADGVRLSHGSRQAYCPSSPIYRDRATALAAEMATHYRDHPALAAWHVGNEYGCHVPRCYCDTCAASFREWLSARYTLDQLNDAWSTAFWSQGYTDFAQILPPRATID